MTVYQTLIKMKKEFPIAKTISVDYSGSGDSFDSFYSVISEEDIELNEREFINEYEDILFAAINKTQADFNNEGSRGTVTFDLENIKVYTDNYFYISTEEYDGKYTLESNSEVVPS